MVAGRIEHMIEALAGPGAGEVDDLTASDLLTLARQQKAAEQRAAADLLVTAARWADLHPPESIHDAATFTVPGCEHEEPIAGEGAPLVAEFCLAELGTVLGISTTAAKKLVGHALELRHRLPRLWAQVQRRTGPGVAGAPGRGGHHPRDPVPDPGGRGVRRCAGRRGRRSDRCGAAGPARRGDDQALRPRRRRPGRGSGGRLPATSTRATRPSTTTTCTSPARCGSRPSSTSPTPSTSTGPSPTAPQSLKALGSDASLGRPPVRCPRRPRQDPDRARPRRGGSRSPAPARRPRGRPARPLRRVPRRAGHRVRTDRADGGGPAAGAPRPGQGLVRATPARRSPSSR